MSDIAGDIGNQKLHANNNFFIVPHLGSKDVVVWVCQNCGYRNIRHVSNPKPETCFMQWSQVN